MGYTHDISACLMLAHAAILHVLYFIPNIHMIHFITPQKHHHTSDVTLNATCTFLTGTLILTVLVTGGGHLQFAILVKHSTTYKFPRKMRQKDN